MKEIRQMSVKEPHLKEAYKTSIEPVQALIQNIFRRLKLKDKPIETKDPIIEDEIDLFKRHLREMFPEMNLEKLQKVNTDKVKSYTSRKQRHCQERQYSFQIRKCADAGCCIAPNIPREKMAWLPDPVLREDEDGHFKIYSEVNGKDTSEADRPTYTSATTRLSLGKKRKATTKTTDPSFNIISTDPDVQGNFSHTAQTARSTTKCVECLEPRVIYGELKLSGRQELLLAELIREYSYTCGAPLTPPGQSPWENHIKIGD